MRSACGHQFTKDNRKVHFHPNPQVTANPQLPAKLHDKMAAGRGSLCSLYPSSQVNGVSL